MEKRKFTLHDFVTPDMTPEAREAFIEIANAAFKKQNELLEKARKLEEKDGKSTGF